MNTFGKDGKFEFTAAELLSYDKFNSKLQAIDDALKTVVATKIHDPMVMKTGWLGIGNSGGETAGSHELIEINPARFEFRATPYFKGLGTGFMLLGLGAVGVQIVTGDGGLTNTVVGAAVGAGFIWAGWHIRFRSAAPVVFDADLGLCWKGRDTRPGNGEHQDLAKLDDIYALQLVPVWQAGDGQTSGYYSYELNLVLRDGERRSVLGDADRYRIWRDADTLGKALAISVWDATEIALGFYEAHR
jgi:hypothetical protein